MIEWDWPQITWLVLAVLGLGFAIAKHGEPTRHNALFSLIGVAFGLVLLLAGGFWHKPEPASCAVSVVPIAE
jgi:CHASE2 domain-containing sensor protein